MKALNDKIRELTDMLEDRKHANGAQLIHTPHVLMPHVPHVLITATRKPEWR
jgi:hypothetical protein